MSAPVYVQASSTDVEMPSKSQLDTPSKVQSHDISWSNVNFAVGDKKILTDCWGNVSTHVQRLAIECLLLTCLCHFRCLLVTCVRFLVRVVLESPLCSMSLLVDRQARAPSVSMAL